MNSNFTTVDVYRGFTEIDYLLDILDMTGGFICGGYVRWMCSPRQNPIPPSDVDIYTIDKLTYDRLLTTLRAEGIGKKHENLISYTFERPKTGNFFQHPPIQLIKPFNRGNIVTSGGMVDILDNFDFSVIRIGLTENEAIADADFIEDETNLRLNIKNIHCPVSSALRCCKYVSKGYHIAPFQIFKLFADWDNRDNGYRERLAILFSKANSEFGSLTQEEIDELESLLRID